MADRFLAALPFLLLGGCTVPGVQPVAHSTPSPTVSAPSAADVAGRWDVVSFEGYRPVSRHGAYANFWPHGVNVRLDCNISRIPGVVQNGRFVTQPGPRMSTEIGCGPERHERDSRFFGFFDRAPTVERLGAGRLRLVAADSVLILERPDQRRLAFLPEAAEIQGRWHMESLTRYGPEDGESGIGVGDIPGRIVIENNRLSYDRCPQYALTFTYSTDGRLVKSGGAALPSDPDCPPLKPTRPMVDMPTPADILPLLHSNPWVEELGAGRMLIANERFGLFLTKEPLSERG